MELADAVIDAICHAHGFPDEKAIEKILIVAAAVKVLPKKPNGGSSNPGFGFGPDKFDFFREGRVGLVPYLLAPLVKDSDDLVPKVIHIGPNEDVAAA